MHTPSTTVDARGKPCPVPILELARAVRAAPVQGLVELWATDPGVSQDLTAWCESTGHRLTYWEELPGPLFKAQVQKLG